MPLVYRIELPNSINNQSKHRDGVYSGNWPEFISDHIYRQPSPHDWFSKPFSSYVFGCPSVDELFAWFLPDFHTTFAQKGFVISVYTVSNDNMQRDPLGRQVAFDSERATLVKEIKYESMDTIYQLKQVA